MFLLAGCASNPSPALPGDIRAQREQELAAARESRTLTAVSNCAR